MQDLQVTSAYTLKPDGTKLPVSPDAILVRQKAMPSPFFSDLKEKVILFPNVEPGDTLVYDSVIQSQARIPGQFYFGAHIPRAIEIDSDTITFVTPKSLPLTFDPYGFAVQKTAEGGNLVYTIRYVNRTPALELPQYLSDLDHGQRVFASSVGTFDALAAGYEPLISTKLAVTPTIIAKANEITAGITDRREQARKLYEWVSAHVRYIALFFGDGGIVPHSADSILANGYGDCKDHTVLYSALLKAKGIASEPVIINATNGYFLPQVPQLLTFNHMIVWLPEFGLYADTTSNTTPFGALPPTDYGKPVIRVGGEVGALQHTPLLTEAEATYSSSSALKLDSEGKLSGTHIATATGAMSGVLRGMANQAGGLGLNNVATAVLRARKLDLATGSLSFAPTVEMTPQYTYSSNFQLGRPLQTDVAFAPPEGLNLVDAYSPALLGPVADPEIPIVGLASLPQREGRGRYHARISRRQKAGVPAERYAGPIGQHRLPLALEPRRQYAQHSSRIACAFRQSALHGSGIAGDARGGGSDLKGLQHADRLRDGARVVEQARSSTGPSALRNIALPAAPMSARGAPFRPCRNCAVPGLGESRARRRRHSARRSGDRSTGCIFPCSPLLCRPAPSGSIPAPR